MAEGRRRRRRSSGRARRKLPAAPAADGSEPQQLFALSSDGKPRSPSRRRRSRSRSNTPDAGAGGAASPGRAASPAGDELAVALPGGAEAPLSPLLLRRCSASPEAVLVRRYHAQRPLGTVSKVTRRSLERKWEAQRARSLAAAAEAEASAGQRAEEAAARERRKAEIREAAVAAREAEVLDRQESIKYKRELVAKRKQVHPSGPTAQKMAATLIQSRIRAMAVRKIIKQKREAAHKATRIFFLVGGPGSGKSTYGKRLTNEFGPPTTPADPPAQPLPRLAFSRRSTFLLSICWAALGLPKSSEVLNDRSASKRC